MPPAAYRRYTLLFILLAFATYLAGNNLVGLWDRDEPRYAQTSHQMLASGDWVVPRLLDNVRTAKPILIYWCQATSMATFGDSPFAARVPSAVAGALTLALLAWLLPCAVGRSRAFWTVFVLGSSGLAIMAAKMCITDGVLLLFVTAAQLALYAVYRGNRSWKVTALLWVAIGLAILTKGPVVLGVQAATMLVLAIGDYRRTRSLRGAIAWWRNLRPLAGLLIVLAIGGPWAWEIHHREPTFFAKALGHDVLNRAANALEGHKGPPGYYALTIWGTYFPWCLLLPTTIAIAWRHRKAAAHRFAIAAVVGPWIMMELVQTKLAHYLLPAFPALAFLTADAIVRCLAERHDDLRRRAMRGAAFIFATIVLVIGAIPLEIAHAWFAPVEGALAVWGAAAFAVAAAYALAVAILFARVRLTAALSTMGLGMLAVVGVLYVGYLPAAWFLWLPQDIGGALRQRGITASGQVVMIDYKEDSLPYYQGGTIRQADDVLLTRSGPDQWPAWIVTTRDLYNRLPDSVSRRLEIVESWIGLAYASRGRQVEILLLRKIAVPTTLPATTQPTRPPIDLDWRAQADARIERYRKGDFTLTVLDADGRPLANTDVVLRQTRSEFLFGMAVSSELRDTSESETRYRKFISDHFNAITPEDRLKWYSIEPRADEFHYEAADRLVAWARSNQMAVRGHCLFWDREKFIARQPWLMKLEPAALAAKVDQHAQTTAAHFKGKVIAWDVNNEMLDGGWFAQRLGADAPARMFKLAHEVDPQVPLYTNEFGILGNSAKTARYVALVNDLRARGAPVGGIGIQEHACERFVTLPTTLPATRGASAAASTRPVEIETEERARLASGSSADIFRSLDELTGLGLPIQLTEVSCKSADPVRRADGFEVLFRTAFSHPQVNAIVLWGFHAHRHWLGADAALVDGDWQLSAAGRRVLDLIERQWRTQLVARTDASGRVHFRGFYGSYEASLVPNAAATRPSPTATLDLTARAPSATVALPR